MGKHLCVCSTNLGFSMIPGTYYVPDTFVPGISRQKSIRTYVMFRTWTHTSDGSYIYQLSLVVATATVSFLNCTEEPKSRLKEEIESEGTEKSNIHVSRRHKTPARDWVVSTTPRQQRLPCNRYVILVPMPPRNPNPKRERISSRKAPGNPTFTLYTGTRRLASPGIGW